MPAPRICRVMSQRKRMMKSDGATMGARFSNQKSAPDGSSIEMSTDFSWAGVMPYCARVPVRDDSSSFWVTLSLPSLYTASTASPLTVIEATDDEAIPCANCVRLICWPVVEFSATAE